MNRQQQGPDGDRLESTGVDWRRLESSDLQAAGLRGLKALRRAARGRRGIALVIVLGLLGLLMITAVAFTIMMRVERAGASNLRHATAARHMARGALSYAIAAIDDHVVDDLYPAWSNRTYEVRDSAEVRRTLRLPEDCFRSIDESVLNSNDVTYARVLSHETVRFLPASLRVAAERSDYSQPEWVPVYGEGGGDVIGRYAYVILNTSGLLDANVVHDPATNRWLGVAPGEIRLHPDAQLDVLDPAKFAINRKKHGRYETLPELAVLTTNETPLALDIDALANFDVFSYSLPELNPSGQPKIDISTEEKIKNQKSAIEQAFVSSGLRADGLNAKVTQVSSAYLGLLDYVDADDEPAGADDVEKFGRPASEAVPMLTELRLECDFKQWPGEPGFVTNQLTWTYQFVFVCPNRAGVLKDGYKADIAFLFVDDGTPVPFNDLLPPPDAVELNDQALPMAIGSHVCDILYPAEPAPHSYTITKVQSAASGKPRLSFGVLAAVRIKNKDGKVVDQVPCDFKGKSRPLDIAMDDAAMPLMFDHYTAGTLVMLEPNSTRDFWMECLDPRLNGYAQNADYWFQSPKLESAGIAGYTPNPEMQDNLCSLTRFLLANPGALTTTRYKLVTDGARRGDPTVAHCDHPQQQFYGHVANKPLQSVGELGYLPIGAWLTVNLFDHSHDDYTPDGSPYALNKLPDGRGYHTVLDYFTVRPTNRPVRGKVHLATRNREVMAAVFNELPLRSELGVNTVVVPGAKGAGSFDDSYELAKWVIDIPGRNDPKTGQPNGPYVRLSDLGRLFRGTTQLGANSGVPAVAEPAQLLAKATSGKGGFGELEREALIRNACELLTLRQQTYTIIIRADSFSPFFGMTGVKKGSVLATAQAVAQVWRDPYPDADGNHPCFVQFFKLIGN